ncbi:TetR/AcrR family transcriptional regulator (plasmid) [Embleya sp. NBC_00888]|uniref:TetR/AcrR family transcriptional regulator n=1 Tax=Embleya sp. NBC_00888 TaxID=2975960 RepID=UPI002F916247|nr:TetR/AcrR family transcriptional regulator [Embleya sp. NBC_00888]
MTERTRGDGEDRGKPSRQNPQPRRGPGRSERGARRREELVTIAGELFARSGFRGTGLAEVAARAGITQPALLYYFGSKEGLLQAVIERRGAQSIEFAQESVAVGGLRAIRELPASAHRNRREPGLARLLAVLTMENLDPEDPAHDYFVQRYRRLRALIARIITDAQATGEIRAEIDPAHKAAELLATMDGLQMQWLLDPTEVDLVTAIESYTLTLIRDLAADPAAYATAATAGTAADPADRD